MSADAQPQSGARARISLLAALAGALVVGAVLRFARLDAQLLIGDELHPLKAALLRSVGEILRNWVYYGADYCVPLTALYRLALDAGLQLSEAWLRAPVLAVGLAAIVVMPLVLRRRLGDRAAAVFALLLAISPLLALYSRIIRSYLPATLAAFLAVLCFEAWWRTRSRAAGAGYGVFAALAIWFNLTTLPFAAAPVVYASVRIALDWRARRADLAPLAAVGAFALACVAAVLLPAAESLLFMSKIHGRGPLPALETWLDVARMHAGSRSPWITALVCAGLARGALLLWRSDRELLLFVASISALHVVGLALLGPSQLDNPIVINRYLIVLLPFGLALCALGLAVPLPRLPSALQWTGVALLLVGILATGPFLDPNFRQTSFAHAPTFTYFVRDGNWLPREAVPRFYRDLEAQPVSERRALIEYPWYNLASHSLDAYQKIHGHPVLVATTAEVLADSRLALRRVVKQAAVEYLAADARWLVVHLDMRAEERRVHTSDRNHWMRLERRPELWEPLLAAGAATARHLTERWGPPDVAEDGLRVWDLDRIRAARP